MAMIRITCILIAATFGGVSASARAQQPAPTPPVAIVSGVRGEATVESKSGRAPLRRFDRLSVGDAVRTSEAAEVVIAFRSGARVRVGAVSRVRVDAAGATKMAGSLDTLAALPPLPLVAPAVGAGTATAAVRIRAQVLAIHAPPIDTVTRADATVLAFAPASTDAYDVEIEDSSATVVYRVRTRETTVPVPATALAAGHAYRWRVTARQANGFALMGEGRFRTLSAEDARARARLHDSAPSLDGDTRALLAEVDWMLGLWREALEGFRAASAAGVDDPVVVQRIAELERRSVSPASQGPR